MNCYWLSTTFSTLTFPPPEVEVVNPYSHCLSFIFPISKANSTLDLHMNLENYSLFPLLRRHTFLKINMVENSLSSKEPQGLQRSIFLIELSVSMIPPSPRWWVSTISNSPVPSPQTTTLSLLDKLRLGTKSQSHFLFKCIFQVCSSWVMELLWAPSYVGGFVCPEIRNHSHHCLNRYK